ncbi:MAG: DsbA family protein [Acidimicrobiia bacterium]|nr:DsbA family protein [Acidimicrobiia bacterium]
MDAACWSDYLCPWCYVGQQRDALMASLGVNLVHRPYELHPEIGSGGLTVRADGRLRATFDRVEAECRAAGVAFRRPTRMANTRRALEAAEWVRVHHEEAFPAVHRGLFAAAFVTGDPLDDAGVVDRVVRAAGAPAEEVRAMVDAGRATALVDASMAEARRVGVSSTPTWVFDGGLVVPGALDPVTVERWVTKVVARHHKAGDRRPVSGP